MRNLKRITLVVIIVTYFLINTSLAKTGNINAQAARLRKENNTSSNIITNVYKGEEVEILEESGDWYKVKYQNNTGYIKKEFITEKVTNTNTNTSTNTQSNTNGNVAASQNNTVQNTNTQNTLAQNTNNQNQNTSAKNTNTQNVANDNKQQTNNQSSENSELVFVSTSAKLRIVPNLMSNKIEKIEAGKQLTKVSEVKNWVQVTDGNIIGWLPKSKITTSSTSEVSNTNTPEIPVETNTSNTTNTVNNVANVENVANATNTSNNTVDNDVSNNTTASNNQSQTTSNKTGKVNVETAKVREKANQSSKFVSLLDYGDTVTIIAEEGDWYQITAGSTSGYIKKTLVTVSDKNISSRSSSEERAPIDNKEDVKVDQETNKAVSSMLSSETSKVTKGEDVVNYAKNYLGTSYVVGGKTPQSGFDCSGFTRYVFANFGYNLGTTAANQNNIGIDVSKEELQAGDLILFYDEGKNRIGHTGIYISNGEFIHAANPQRGVVTDNLNTNTYYNERFIVAKRIVD